MIVPLINTLPVRTILASRYKNTIPPDGQTAQEMQNYTILTVMNSLSIFRKFFLSRDDESYFINIWALFQSADGFGHPSD
jgi:hypothetical protein